MINLPYSGLVMTDKEFSMKNTLKVLGIIAFIAVIGFTSAACKGAEEPKSTTYTSVGSDGNTYELVITKDPNRAAYTPQAGDSYVLTITFTDGTKKTSSGKVESGSVDSGFTLKPTSSETTFTVTVSSEKMEAISGTIKTDKGDVAAPANIFAVTNTKDSPKIVTITGFPTEYEEEQLALTLQKTKDDWSLEIGGMGWRVANGSITIPLWKDDKEYTGTGDFYVSFKRYTTDNAGYQTKTKVSINSANTTVRYNDFVYVDSY